MENYTIIFIVLLLVISIINFIILLRNRPAANSNIADSLKPLQEEIARLSNGLKEEFRISRTENFESAKANREELNNQIASFRSETAEAIRALNDKNVEALQKLNSAMEQRILALIDKTENSFKSFSEGNTRQLEKIEKQVEGKLQTINEQSKADSQQMRDSISSAFKEFQTVFDKNVQSFNDLQRDKFNQLEARQNELVNATEKKLESIRNTVEEKLEKTLSERLGQSFETVGKQLIEVQRGLGEMQNLAQDVGGLKKVLSNVKMRGGIGEVQLAMLLEQVLAPEQYQANVKTKKGEDSIVEFAIKLPGKESNEPVWLPVDAKFPRDKYEQLQDAYDAGDITRIQQAQKYLEEGIRSMAKDISQKYLNPPSTTDFGIMFLPFEGIYAEVVRKASLLEEIQRDYKIIITGPSTLAAILNSLQMGFRTLAIQKRSGEVWKVLGAVKKEFEAFGGLLSKAQNKIQAGLDDLDNVVGVRTRVINKKLKDVTVLDDAEARQILPEITSAELLEDEDKGEE
ncbi:MAG: DNA recombination protein RmuC [Arcticibacter sp.]